MLGRQRHKMGRGEIAMNDVIEFRRPKQGAKTIRAELILPERGTRRRWAVVERMPDGSSHVYRSSGKKDALFLAATLQRLQEKRQQEYDAMMVHPLGKLLLTTPVEELEMINRFAEGALSLLAGLGHYAPCKHA